MNCPPTVPDPDLFHAQSTIPGRPRPRPDYGPAVFQNFDCPKDIPHPDNVISTMLPASFPNHPIIVRLVNRRCHAATNAPSVSTVLLRPRGHTPCAFVASGIPSTAVSAAGFHLRRGGGVALRLRFAKRFPRPPLHSPRSPTADRSVRADSAGSPDTNSCEKHPELMRRNRTWSCV